MILHMFWAHRDLVRCSMIAQPAPIYVYDKANGNLNFQPRLKGDNKQMGAPHV